MERSLSITGRNIDRFAITSLCIQCELYAKTGMKMTRGPAPTSIAKKMFNLKGNAQKIAEQMRIIKENADVDLWPDDYAFRNSEDLGKTGKDVNPKKAIGKKVRRLK